MRAPNVCIEYGLFRKDNPTPEVSGLSIRAFAEMRKFLRSLSALYGSELLVYPEELYLIGFVANRVPPLLGFYSAAKGDQIDRLSSTRWTVSDQPIGHSDSPTGGFWLMSDADHMPKNSACDGLLRATVHIPIDQATFFHPRMN